jgi:hypothetical protein
MNSPCTHEPLSPAVQRCCDARNRMIELDRRSLDPDYKPEGMPETPKDDNLRALFEYQAKTLIHLNDHDPSFAFRAALPEPVGRRQIKQYIACVMHGMAIEAITAEEGKSLIYGARAAVLAISKYRDRTKTPKRRPSEYGIPPEYREARAARIKELEAQKQATYDAI